MKQTILIFGGIAIAVLLLFQLSQFALGSIQNPNEIFIVIAGALFILLGFMVNKYLYNRGVNETAAGIDEAQLQKTKLSKQEYKVLTLMSDGLSNMEIAENLFISENTVKTHVSKILYKLNAKRRTEAVKIGRDLNII